MTDNSLTVVPLIPRDLKPDEGVIERLEFLLGEAKAGRVAGISVAWLDEKYHVAYLKTGVQSCGTMGALYILQMLIGQYITDTAENL